MGYYSAVAAFPACQGPTADCPGFPGASVRPAFVQQDFSDSLPDWMGRAEVGKDDGGVVVHPVANCPEALVWLANQNCVTLHAWLSRRDKLITRTTGVRPRSVDGRFRHSPSRCPRARWTPR